MITAAISEIVLADNAWGRALARLSWWPSNVNAPQTLVGLGLPPVDSSWPQPQCGRHLSSPSAQPWVV